MTFQDPNSEGVYTQELGFLKSLREDLEILEASWQNKNLNPGRVIRLFGEIIDSISEIAWAESSEPAGTICGEIKEYLASAANGKTDLSAEIWGRAVELIERLSESLQRASASDSVAPDSTEHPEAHSEKVEDFQEGVQEDSHEEHHEDSCEEQQEESREETPIESPEEALAQEPGPQEAIIFEYKPQFGCEESGNGAHHGDTEKVDTEKVDSEKSGPEKAIAKESEMPEYQAISPQELLKKTTSPQELLKKAQEALLCGEAESAKELALKAAELIAENEAEARKKKERSLIVDLENISQERSEFEDAAGDASKAIQEHEEVLDALGKRFAEAEIALNERDVACKSVKDEIETVEAEMAEIKEKHKELLDRFQGELPARDAAERECARIKTEFGELPAETEALREGLRDIELSLEQIAQRKSETEAELEKLTAVVAA